jgi:hypothetical protein
VELVQGSPVRIKRVVPNPTAEGESEGEADSEGEFSVQWAAGQRRRFDLVLAAVGRQADTAGLQLHAAGVATTGTGTGSAGSGANGGAGEVVVVGPPGAAATANPKM